jgi:hypothetical protein
VGILNDNSRNLNLSVEHSIQRGYPRTYGRVHRSSNLRHFWRRCRLPSRALPKRQCVLIPERRASISNLCGGRFPLTHIIIPGGLITWLNRNIFQPTTVGQLVRSTPAFTDGSVIKYIARSTFLGCLFIGLAMAVWTSAGISGGHVNPAVSHGVHELDAFGCNIYLWR